MHKTTAVSLQNISKVYKLYDKPINRLKESLHPLKKKYHKDFYALKNINLEIKKGEVLGIVGVNGAGKSTLLKIISDVLTPTTGRVNIHGRINAILELGSSLKPELTGRENIKLNLRINGIDKDIEKLTQEIVEFADIGEHIDQPVKSYSSGMKARLGFGIATSTDPDILIVDEVLAVGDVLFQRKCYSKIENLFKDGKTVIFVSHSAQSVIEFCSRAVLLYDREIIMDDTPKKVTDYYQKLIFSKDRQRVIEEIGKSKLSTQEREPKKESQLSVKKDEKMRELRYSKEYYSPQLQSKPTLLKNTTTHLEKIFIVDRFNEVVNILKTDETYVLCLAFSSCSDEIENLGISFQTNRALTLSSTRERLKSPILHNLYVEWEFKCVFLKGDYFIKLNLTDANKEIIIRVADALLFKVQNVVTNELQYKLGLVDLNQKVRKVLNDSH